MAGKPVISGNWKMHHGPSATTDFFADFDPSGLGNVELLLFPPALSFAAACEARGDTPVHLGVQNVHWEEKGAFTGELSVAMAADAGASHVLIGHSERRHVFGETNEETGHKVDAVVAGGLIPVLCVGETLEQRKAGNLESVLLAQLDAGLAGLDAAPRRFLVAYEPVWAIGTGETATPLDASGAHAVLRQRLTELWGADRGAEVPILYGGSVKPHNAGELLAAPEVGGVLVGGASLDPASFRAIAESA